MNCVCRTKAISNCYSIYSLWHIPHLWGLSFKRSFKGTFTFQNLQDRPTMISSQHRIVREQTISCQVFYASTPSHPPTMLQPHSLLTRSCKNSEAVTSPRYSREMWVIEHCVMYFPRSTVKEVCGNVWSPSLPILDQSYSFHHKEMWNQLVKRGVNLAANYFKCLHRYRYNRHDIGFRRSWFEKKKDLKYWW